MGSPDGIKQDILTYTNLSIILTYKILTRKILTRKILTCELLKREGEIICSFVVIMN